MGCWRFGRLYADVFRRYHASRVDEVSEAGDIALRFLVPTFAVVLMAGGGYAVSDLQPLVSPRASDMAGLQAHETHASASLLGQFRTSFSSWLWFRTDLYLHNGVEMRQMTDDEK